MDFISDAEMDTMSASKDFISDEDMAKQSAPDFIPDTPSLVDLIPGAHSVTPTPDPTTFEYMKGSGEAIGNVISGGTTGMLGGTLGMIGNPVKQAVTGNIKSYGDFSKALEEGFFGGMEAGTYQPKTEAGQEIVSKFVAPVIENLMPMAGLAGSLGHAPSKVKGIKEVRPELKFGVEKEFIPEASGISKGEHDMLSKVQRNVDDKVRNINEQITVIEEKIGKTGIARDEDIMLLQYLEGELNKKAKDLVDVESILSGDVTKSTAEELALRQDLRIQEIMEQMKEQRKGRSMPYVEAPPEGSLVPPVEVALNKIGEALQEPPERVSVRLDTVIEKLSKIPEEATGEYNALRESLLKEKEAYESILKGEQPNLSWFENKQVLKEVSIPRDVVDGIVNRELPSATETHWLLRDAKTTGEAFAKMREEGVGTKGQRVLMDLLEKIPHAMSAKLEHSLATIMNDRGAKASGHYDAGTHTVALHEAATIKTVLHETIHAATVHLLDQGTSKATVAFKALFDKYNDFLGTVSNKAGVPHYGFKNVKEFISEAFTNPEFQSFLAKIASDSQLGKKSLSMWEKFKQLIKESLNFPNEYRSVLDDVLDAGANLMESVKTRSEEVFQKMSEKTGADKVSFNTEELPTNKTMRGVFGRNFFGMNTMEGFYLDHPLVQDAFKGIRESWEQADKIQNSLWHGTGEVISSGKMHFYDTLSKVKNKGSAIIAVMKTSDADMGIIHDLFKKGFEDAIDYASNLEKNGGHLTPEQVKTYTVLSELFENMYKETVKVQRNLNKAHELPYRAGWYPANRKGKFSVEVSFKGNLTHKQTFPTRQSADVFRKKLTDGTNLKFLDVSDVIDSSIPDKQQLNIEMANIIGDHLEKKYREAGPALKETIDDLMYTMQSRGGKLGYHHQFRANVSGYKGSELFHSSAELGNSFKEGIQGEVNNFGMNLRTLMVKAKLQGKVESQSFKESYPVDHAAIEQMYESALGRNKDFFEQPERNVIHAVDKIVDTLSQKVLGKQFEAKRDSALGKVSNTSMRAFYATKMMAKPVFLLGQLLTTPMIIPELARDGHGLRAFASFGKGVTKLLTGDKVLWDHIKQVSQEYNVFEAQFLESMNLDKHTNTKWNTEKVLDMLEDYVVLGKVGKAADSTSRLISYATAYTHFTDLGLKPAEASYKARLVTDKAMNVYETGRSAPIFEKLGAVGRGMKPLSSFGLNQLGNVASYLKEAKKGNVGPIIAYGLVTTAMGGIFSLPFIQEYERFRKVAGVFFDLNMPSILQVMASDESFLDRLQIVEGDKKDVLLYGLPALSGMDLSTSIRTNETMFSILAAIALGEEDASKLLPILGATKDTVAAIPKIAKTLAGNASVGEGRKAVDALVTGPIGYGTKEALDLNTTRFLGKQTGMMPTGVAGDADMPRTKQDIVAGYLGTKTIAQKKQDQLNFDLVAQDKQKQKQIQNGVNMLVETGDNKYIQKLLDLGLTAEKIDAGIKSGAYNKNVDQYIRYFRSAQGTIDPKKASLMMHFQKGNK